MSELRRLLELTLEQHRIKRLIDLARARVDETARTELARTGAAPSWKIRGLGAIRLDGMDPEPVAYIADEDALASYVAENWPTEAIATIVVPSNELEKALEALRFAEVDVDKATVTTRAQRADRILKTAQLVELDPTDDGTTRYTAVDPDGVEIPGVAGRIASNPRLVVAADPGAKADAVQDADAEDQKHITADDTTVVDDTEIDTSDEPVAKGA